MFLGRCVKWLKKVENIISSTFFYLKSFSSVPLNILPIIVFYFLSYRRGAGVGGCGLELPNIAPFNAFNM